MGPGCCVGERGMELSRRLSEREGWLGGKAASFFDFLAARRCRHFSAVRPPGKVSFSLSLSLSLFRRANKTASDLLVEIMAMPSELRV